MTTIITVIIIAAILGGASFYIYKEKKNGAKCIGCPHSKSCGKNCCCGSGKG